MELFVFSAAALVVIVLLKSRTIKGRLGEGIVNAYLRFFFDRDVYRSFYNVTLPTKDGMTQVDHLVISRYGIFVVETKNMKGWIFGSADQPQWKQVFPKASYRFQNPLRQNYKHVKALEAVLPVKPEFIHSVIVFVGGATFKTGMPPNVVQGLGFVKYLRSFTAMVMTDATVAAICEDLARGRLADTKETRALHIKNLQERANPDAARLCPRCGERMLVRESKQRGQSFWGCSTFPRCRQTQAMR